MIILLWSTILATLVGLASAAVIPRDSGFHILSQGQISSTDTFANYAATAMCSAQSITYWSCGPSCLANPNFELYATGGGSGSGSGSAPDYPQWYAGYDNSQDSIMLVHEGNDGPNFFNSLTNANAAFTSLDPTIFANISSSIQVYGPYAGIHSQSVSGVLQALGDLIQAYPEASVTTVGYSLGGALALLDGLLVRMLLSPNTDVRVVAYGLSRVGNAAFAGFVDAMLPQSVKRINNKRDPYAIVPAISLGYHNVRGEIHIQSNGKWIACPDDDNADPRCSVGTVTSINNANVGDHMGPYDGVTMTCSS